MSKPSDARNVGVGSSGALVSWTAPAYGLFFGALPTEESLQPNTLQVQRNLYSAIDQKDTELAGDRMRSPRTVERRSCKVGILDETLKSESR